MHLLAHAGPGASWQAMLVVLSLGLVVVVVLTVLGRLPLEGPGDLVLPLAVIAIASSIAPLGDRWLSDWIGWAFPVGVVMLIAVLLAALTPLELSTSGSLLYAAVGIAVAGAVVLYQPLTIAWHPPAQMLPEAGDAEIVVHAPADGSTLPAGETTVEVEVREGGIGPGGVPFEDLPFDPAEAGALSATVDGERVEVDLDQDCPQSDPCERASFAVDLPEGDEVVLRVELTRGDGMPFAPPVTDRVEVTVG